MNKLRSLNRLQKVRGDFPKFAIDALFVTSQPNVTYLTNFQGFSPYERKGYIFLTQKQAYLFLYPTTYGLYHNISIDFTTLSITSENKLADWIEKICREQKISRIGIEKENLTLKEAESLEKNTMARFIPTEGIIQKQRVIKDKEEIQQIQKAAQITDRAFSYIINKIKKGKTEKDLALDLEFYIKKNAQDVAFSPIVAFGNNAAIPHYLASNACHLKPDTLILLDFGAKVGNYCSDMTRVIFFGKPDSKFIKIYQAVQKAQEIAIDNLNALIKKDNNNIGGSFIDKKVKDYIVSRGFPPYPHGLGHGVGIEIHEDPRLKSNSEDILKEGMVFTIEPGIYIEGWGGVRIEDLVVFNNNGIEILSKSPKSLQSLIID